MDNSSRYVRLSEHDLSDRRDIVDCRTDVIVIQRNSLLSLQNEKCNLSEAKQKNIKAERERRAFRGASSS